MNTQNNRPINDSKLTILFGPRLVTLCNGQPGLRGKIQVEIREPSAAQFADRNGDTTRPGDKDVGVTGADAPAGQGAVRTPHPTFPEPDGSGSNAKSSSSEPSPPNTRPPSVLDFIASDETLDRYNEVIVASGWKLDNYVKNPVFQNSHQYGDIIYTLGRALVTEVRTVADRKVLFQRVEFATEANPIAKIAYNLYKGKFLNAVSVGFIPRQWENGEPGNLWNRRYTEQELLEVSAVGIPANPNALALGLKAGAITKQQIKDLGALMHYVLRPRKPFEPQRRVTEKYLRMLKLAAAVRELVKKI